MSWSDFLISQAKDALNDTIQDTGNSTAKFQSTPEGKAVAYLSLIVMAIAPIILGSHKSVKYLKKQVDNLKVSADGETNHFNVFQSNFNIWTNGFLPQITGGQPDAMTTKDAAMFPIIASVALFGIYMFFKVDDDRGRLDLTML